jgi:molecular chaperone GrpE
VAGADVELEAQRDRYLRLAAEFENYKKRTAREWRERVQSASAEVLLELLDVVDNFERALGSEQEDSPRFRGLLLIQEQLSALLARRGVEPFTVTGTAFDPERHEALVSLPSEIPAGYVCQELRRGYTQFGRLLRPAQVAVSTGTADSGVETEDRPEESNQEPKSGAEHE